MKKSTKIFLVILAVLVCVGAYFIITTLYKKSLEGEKISNERLYTLTSFPKIDASLATQPLTNAIVRNFTGEEGLDDEALNGILNYSNTHPGYVKLINDEVDLIVVTEPSEEELALAKEKGVELEVIPVVKEGFVFYVNKDNKVQDLTVEQIQKIYTGEITNWKQIGGDNEPIIAYQRPVNSGSQTGMLSLVMKGLKLMEAPKERLVDSMYEIVNLVSSYKNGINAIGYSYYYYATTMFQAMDKEIASNVRMLGVNGVKPTNATIKDGSYPFQTAYYIVINKADAEDSPARTLANQLLSARGQKVAEDAGYVPVK